MFLVPERVTRVTTVLEILLEVSLFLTTSATHAWHHAGTGQQRLRRWHPGKRYIGRFCSEQSLQELETKVTTEQKHVAYFQLHAFEACSALRVLTVLATCSCTLVSPMIWLERLNKKAMLEVKAHKHQSEKQHYFLEPLPLDAKLT